MTISSSPSHPSDHCPVPSSFSIHTGLLSSDAPSRIKSSIASCMMNWSSVVMSLWWLVMRVLYQVPPQGATTTRIGVDRLWITLFYFYVPHPLTFCPDSAEPLGTPTPRGASKIARQKIPRKPRHINILGETQCST